MFTKYKNVFLAVGFFVLGVVGTLFYTARFGAPSIIAPLLSKADGECNRRNPDYVGHMNGPAGSSTVYDICIDTDGNMYWNEWLIRGQMFNDPNYPNFHPGWFFPANQ